MNSDMKTELIELNKEGEDLHHRSRRKSQFSDIIFNEDEAPKNIVKVLTKVTLICLTFMVIELVGGILSDSVAVISDALHLGIDVIGYLIQMYSAWLATRKANKKYSFGYLRAEPIGALINCFTIWGLTVYLVYEAVRRLYHPSTNFDPRFMLFTSAFGVFANLMMGVAVSGLSILKYMIIYPCLSADQKDKIVVNDGSENLNIRAVMAHVLGDLVYSVGVFIAAVVINYKPEWQFIDSLCTILFSFVVLHITVPVFRDSMNVIMEAVPVHINKEEIKQEINDIEIVGELKSLRIWSITQDKICANIHVCLEDDIDEQLIQNKIGRILKEKEITYWTIQCWKGNQNVCFVDDEI